MKISKRSRSLRCVVNGRVISLGELRDEPWGSRCGYTVIRRRKSSIEQLMIKQLQKLLPKIAEKLSNGKVDITSPADGVVISVAEGQLTLRTGDGIPVTAAVGKGLQLLPQIGRKVRCGEVICSTCISELEANGTHGAVAVFFPRPEMITELHIFAGYRRSSYRTAFYRVQKT